MTFAAALKAFLRQDPNIIMVARSATSRRAPSRSRRPHGPLGALDPAHQRRAVHHHRMVDMASSRSTSPAPSIDRGAAAGAADLQGLPQGARVHHEEMHAFGSTRAGALFQGAGCDTCAGSGTRAAGLYEVMSLSSAVRRGFSRVPPRRSCASSPCRRHVDAPHGRHDEGQEGRHDAR